MKHTLLRIFSLFGKATFCGLILFVSSSVVWADSPLTSTYIYSAYQDEPMVQIAAKSKGILTQKLMGYLADEENPIAVKMAIINRIGWRFRKNQNSKAFYAFLSKKYGTSDPLGLQNKANGDELLSLGYLLAFDNYSNDLKLKEAVEYANIALYTNPTSVTYILINGLIQAQIGIGDNWCSITSQIKNKVDVTFDLSDAAIKNIFKYMDADEDICISNFFSDEDIQALPPPTPFDLKLKGKWTDVEEETNVLVAPIGNYVGTDPVEMGTKIEISGNTTYAGISRIFTELLIVEIKEAGTIYTDDKYLTFNNKINIKKTWNAKTLVLKSTERSVLPPVRNRYKLEDGEEPGTKILKLWSAEDEAKYPNSPTSKFRLMK